MSHKETACGDSLLQSVGNPVYRLEDMMMRRRIAALCNQPRTVQRYTKKIAALREAFGMPHADDEPDFEPQYMMNKRVNEGVTQPIASTPPAAPPVPPTTVTTEAASFYDRDWMRAQTVRGVAAIAAAYSDGKVERSAKDGITTYVFSRMNERPLELRVLGNSWCVSAREQGSRLPLFDYNDTVDGDARGIPNAIAASDWDGVLPISDAQAYAVSWAKLLKIVKG